MEDAINNIPPWKYRHASMYKKPQLEEEILIAPHQFQLVRDKLPMTQYIQA